MGGVARLPGRSRAVIEAHTTKMELGGGRLTFIVPEVGVVSTSSAPEPVTRDIDFRVRLESYLMKLKNLTPPFWADKLASDRAKLPQKVFCYERKSYLAGVQRKLKI